MGPKVEDDRTPTATRMRAAVQDRYGPTDRLALREVPVPRPAADQVLVKVRAAGVGPSVWHLAEGTPHLVRLMGFGLRAPKQPVPGSDVAGVVHEVGADVTRFRPGDEVFGAGVAAFATYALLREDRCVHKPARLSFEQAAAVPDSALTALQAVRDRGRITAGQRVLIIGAAGGVGTYAVQLAVSMGARVTGVCSTSKADLVASLGAERVIDYTREDPLAGSPSYDLIVDTAGNRSLRRLRRALATDGTLVIVGGEGGGRLTGGVGRQLRGVLLTPFVGQRLTSLFATVRGEDLAELGRLVEEGSLTPVVDRSFPLDEVTAAIRYVRDGAARGKVVVTM